MNIDATGFVGEFAGSVASANAVLVRELLQRQHSIRFFTKPSFVDPRAIGLSPSQRDKLTVQDCTNHLPDQIRRRTARLPFVNRISSWADSFTYHRRLVATMRSANKLGSKSDVCLWLGDFARGRVEGVPSVAYLQGPPGTDARSVARHRDLLIRLAGYANYQKLRAYAAWRLGFGYPDLSRSDHLIVGSQWSRSELIRDNQVHPDRVHAIAYPIDLNVFRPGDQPRKTTGPIHLLWLGRFVPRKRLDLLLDGMALAIRGGCDVTATIIGSSGFVPNFEKLIQEFPFPEKIIHRPSVPRSEVVAIFANVDVLVQPSDDENFGSSVAEALACGVPCIVGQTNGTGDYVCERSIILADDSPSTMAEAIVAMSNRKSDGELKESRPSREVAERCFCPDLISDSLIKLLQSVQSE